jgi:hypothetical protein
MAKLSQRRTDVNPGLESFACSAHGKHFCVWAVRSAAQSAKLGQRRADVLIIYLLSVQLGMYRGTLRVHDSENCFEKLILRA